MKIARIQNGIVVNIESVSQEWYDTNRDETIMVYDESNPAFVGGDYIDGKFYPPKPYPSWSRDGQGNWTPPVAMPEDGSRYVWNEETQSWDRF